MKQKDRMGKMVVKIYPVSFKQYTKIMKKVEFLASIHGLKYHAKFIPNGGKK